MSTRFDFDNFLSQFGLDHDSVCNNPNLTYENLVLREYGALSVPLQVVQILETPRGPTQHQEGAIGCILPYLESNGIEGLSLNMNTLNPVPETPETLIIQPYGYVMSALLACLDNLSKGEISAAIKKAKYIQDILPYLANGATWSLSPQDPSSEKPFTRFGTIKTVKQIQNPYTYVNDIF